MCGSLSPHPPSLLTAHSRQLCHLPSHFTSLCWQPSISVSITLAACPARCLHYLTNDITPSCVPASACSPIHPSPTPITATLSFSHLRLPLSGPSFRSSLPGCRVSLHINRTLVTAFSASSCLLSPSRCSIFSIMCLHAPTFLTVASFLPSCSLHPSLSPFSSPSPSFPLCPSCLLPLSVLTTYSICHQNPPSLLFHSPSITTLPSFPAVLFSHPSSSIRGIVEAASSSCTSVARHLPPLYSSVPLFSPFFPPLSSLSISLSAVDGGAGCWPKTRRG